MSQLCEMAGCKMIDRGGLVPEIDAFGETRIFGIAAAYRSGFMTAEEKNVVAAEESALQMLRKGMFAPENRGKVLEYTDEGITNSMNLLRKGYIADEEIEQYPSVKKMKGIHPVIECTQNLPCNPCQDACSKGCIRIGADITHFLP